MVAEPVPRYKPGDQKNGIMIGAATSRLNMQNQIFTKLCAYGDSNSAGDIATAKCPGGYMIPLKVVLIDWRSCKHRFVFALCSVAWSTYL